MHTKARIKAQATEGSDKFGMANNAERVLTTSDVETNNGGNEVGMKAIEGYLDNLATAATNENSVLEQLVANNSKLAATNEDLVGMVKSCPTRLRISKEKPPASRKRAAAGNHKKRGTRTCAPTVKMKGIMHLMHNLNSRRTRTSACLLDNLVVTMWDRQQGQA